jgi:hypothetical protein
LIKQTELLKEDVGRLGAVNHGVGRKRRSCRLQIAMPVVVRGKNSNVPFTEKTRTASVNAHGCEVQLAEKVVRGQDVTIVNPNSAEELPCRVISIGQTEAGKTEVGLEFIEPSPLFWQINFPPEDWDATERKRPAKAKTSSSC